VVDYLWALFESCWHVKDWLKEDNSLLTSIGQTGQDVEDEVDLNSALTACCGIANRSKHWDLKRRSTIIRSGDAKVLGRIMVRLPEGSTSIEYEVNQKAIRAAFR
jgi:hypothetical protein